MTETSFGGTAKWVEQSVIPQVAERVRAVHMLADSKALVFAESHAVFAERGKFGGVKLFRVEFPPGFLLNGSHCPHCGEQLLEPVGKIARLADERSKSARPPSKKGHK